MLASTFRAEYCVPVSSHKNIKLRVLFSISVELSVACGEGQMLTYLFEFLRSVAMRDISLWFVSSCNVVEIC
jgi:hypothetical protein